MLKKKIALIPDVQGWAFDIAANIIKNNLSDEFDIDIFYAKENNVKKSLFEILEQLKSYDIIHFFWRAILLDFEKDDFKNEVILKYGDYDEYVSEIIPKISTGVYDHLFENDLNFNKTFTSYCNSYVVSSQKLFDIYNNQNIKKPNCIMGDCFDSSLFFPENLKRFDDIQNKDEKLIIGWVGNSSWNSKEKDSNNNPIDFKGFNTILKPVIEDMQNKNYNIELFCADKNTNFVPNNKMREYYSKIHIYICVSDKEGTPKPLLEAMGCAVPIITTDIGVAKQALGPLESDYIIGSRLIGQNDNEIRILLEEKLKYLYNNREFLKMLSNENYKFSKHYEISEYQKIYRQYFRSLK